MYIKPHELKDDSVVINPFLGIDPTAFASSKIGVWLIGFQIDRVLRWDYKQTEFDTQFNKINEIYTLFVESRRSIAKNLILTNSII